MMVLERKLKPRNQRSSARSHVGLPLSHLLGLLATLPAWNGFDGVETTKLQP